MKNLILIIAAVAMSHSSAFAQSCLPDTTYFSTQAQIDSFSINFPGCTIIEGDVYIAGQDITNLDGFSMLTSVEGNLSVGYSYGGWSPGLIGSPLLVNINGLENLKTIGGYLGIMKNPSLLNLNGLINLEAIEGSLIIMNNAGLVSLSGLESQNNIGGSLIIQGNNSLLNLNGLDNLSSVGGGVSIHSNNSLVSLSGLDSLSSVTGGVGIGSFDQLGGYGIQGNPVLQSLENLGNLQYIGGSLGIYGNNNLTSLAGLENLTSIGGWLIIADNQELATLAGIENINAGSIAALQIYLNESLSTCEVQSICSYLAAPNGTVSIHSNAPGCNSPEEVEEACDALGIMHLVNQNGCIAYPNPVADKLTLDCSGITDNIELIEIYNTFGAKVAAYRVNQMNSEITLDVQALPTGLYFLRLQAGNEVRTGKVIKY
jgi:hypothetical protein